MILRSSERRVEVVANNVANVSTPGFRRQVPYATLSSSLDSSGQPAIKLHTDHEDGRLSATNRTLDVAISGPGFFQLKDGEVTVYSRAGQFRRLEDGRVANAQGHILQQSGGGDLVLESGAVEILSDGTIVENDRPVARIPLFAPEANEQLEPAGGSVFAISGTAAEVDQPQLRQGMLETSNVVLGDEMVLMMAALRQAESGARLVTLYDELMGRAITSLGQAR